MRRLISSPLTVVTAALVALTLLAGVAHAQKKTLVVALNQDPDILDPTLARTYVGRIVFAHICEKLYEIDEGLRISPQLAAALPAITDGGRTVTINYLAAAAPRSVLLAEAREIKQGRRAGFYHLSVATEDGRAVASAQAVAHRPTP